ncbi:RNA 3'-terminal phosphate cyclase-like protein, partial [Sinocyclocheilus grahami]|uniref:RNA 3'-terminal phosphate cyclase-like protein n=1 Tax=Sinocyclocheilus grahami TaxID=75366 RepID=UPI0007AC9BF9
MEFEGCCCFRQRLVLSTLSGKRVKIRNIRSKDDNPGLRGTVLFYQPGLLYGGSVEHECNIQRSVGYYLEALLMLAPFMKTPLRAVLKGVTNDPADPSVDLLKVTAIPLMKKFGIDGDGLEIKVLKRGMAPAGGGEVLFTCPVRCSMKPVHLTEPGKIKRIRGTAFSVRVSPQMANRIVDSARSILGGCVDSTNQSLALLYMMLGQQDVSKTLLGPLSPYT